MIRQVDEALAALLRREVLDDARVEVVFDPPTKDWAAKRSGPAVDLFLYDIREDVRHRSSGRVPRMDGDGRVVARSAPPRLFRLSYLVTAWTQRAEDEHRLLADLLVVLLAHEVLPPDLLPEASHLVRLTVGLPPEEDRSFADVWSALGGQLRPSIDLVVSVPMEAGRPVAAGPPVAEPLVLDMAGTDGTRAEQVGGARTGGDGPPPSRDGAATGRRPIARARRATEPR